MQLDQNKYVKPLLDLTGIPVTKLSQAENNKLINMEAELSKEVVGQSEAVGSLQCHQIKKIGFG